MSCFSKRVQIYAKFYFRQVFLKNNQTKLKRKMMVVSNFENKGYFFKTWVVAFFISYNCKGVDC